ncbi:Mrp/NBP35 family ATP-binding protein [Helicobacter cetorum]|uniref:Mrp/NBP35 family ATP-binding protein n=1 Tax=Helicobacter cetorum TaxID=138563 RepID=UPI000CF15683|nr:Mrp/NBP35 family ATP-binding protein [Helicobacter cetorum]
MLNKLCYKKSLFIILRSKMLTQEDILNALKKIIYPNFEKDIVSFGFVKNITLHENKLGLLVEIPSSSQETSEILRENISKAVQEIGVKEVNLDIKTPPKPQSPKPTTKNLAKNIKHVVMVSSGKGGVGKSTTSVNLSIALANLNKKVGLLDADVYGPNIPRMMGLQNADIITDPSGKKLIPLKAFGVSVMSMGLLYDEGQSLIWRGPMLMRAIEQMLSDIIWGDLDVLVVDMPPGTGDAQLTLAQAVPLSAGITVTTPQVVSLDDAKRSLDMFKKLHIPIAGIVENMGTFVCEHCDKESEIFGSNSMNELLETYNTQILAKLPLEPKVRIGGDKGEPIVIGYPNSVSAKTFEKMAQNLNAFLDKVEHEKLADNKDIQPTQTQGCSH